MKISKPTRRQKKPFFDSRALQNLRSEKINMQALTPHHLVPADLLFHPLIDSSAKDKCQNWNCVKRVAAPRDHQALLRVCPLLCQVALPVVIACTGGSYHRGGPLPRLHLGRRARTSPTRVPRTDPEQERAPPQ